MTTTTTGHPVPSPHLARLPERLRVAVTGALEHSAAAGFVVGDEEVRLLVAYALGEVTAQDYAEGVLRALGFAAVPARSAPERPDPDPLTDPVPAPDPGAAARDDAVRIRREDAVRAYVTGEIPVNEFLRIARG